MKKVTKSAKVVATLAVPVEVVAKLLGVKLHARKATHVVIGVTLIGVSAVVMMYSPEHGWVHEASTTVAISIHAIGLGPILKIIGELTGWEA